MTHTQILIDMIWRLDKRISKLERKSKPVITQRPLGFKKFTRLKPKIFK